MTEDPATNRGDAERPVIMPAGRPARPARHRSAASRLTGRIALVRRYGVPFFSQFVRDTDTCATVFLRRRGRPLVGKYFVDSDAAAAELRAERLSWQVFGGEPWRMPVVRFGRRSMWVPRLPGEARLDIMAPSMNHQQRLDAATWALEVLIDIYRAGYLHGDLQPHNVWCRDGSLVVTDWASCRPRSNSVRFLDSADVTGVDPAHPQRFDPAFDPEDPWSFANTLGVGLDEALAALTPRLRRTAESTAVPDRQAVLDGDTATSPTGRRTR